MKALQIMFIGFLALVLAGCSAQQTGSATANGTDHGAMSDAEHGSSHATNAPYDAQFIDGMTIHHKGAVSMAEQALNESQRPEITQLAQNIIATQNQEIEQMANWRKQWYPDVATTNGTGGHMGDMELASDTSIPFDQRFITAMIGHHDGAITMAKEALTKAEHGEIKQLAQTIITAQEAEVKQLQEWQKAWFAE
jgi:uncharacterized protein (DUF305 family)